MADVATEAGVAVQTVYFTFHTKAELLDACVERGVMGDEDPRIPQEQPFWTAMVASKDAPGALRHFADGMAAIERRLARLNLAVASATHEPDAVALWRRSEQLRRAGFREAIDYLDMTFGLREGLDAGTATDILLAMGSHNMYCSLVHDYGWSHDAFVDWLSSALGEMLLQ